MMIRLLIVGITLGSPSAQAIDLQAALERASHRGPPHATTFTAEYATFVLPPAAYAGANMATNFQFRVFDGKVPRTAKILGGVWVLAGLSLGTRVLMDLNGEPGAGFGPYPLYSLATELYKEATGDIQSVGSEPTIEAQ